MMMMMMMMSDPDRSDTHDFLSVDHSNHGLTLPFPR